MKRAHLLVALAASLIAYSSAARADQATLKDIEKTFGQVPTFLKTFPPEALEAAWGDMKALQLNPATAIPGKYKELIGLAVAAQIPCRYCIYFHGEAAKLNGASEAELKDAVVVAASARRWSTVLNGNQTDEQQFRAEIQKFVETARSGKLGAGSGQPVVDAPSARKDIEKTFGFVPGFFNSYPEVALAPAWRLFKATELAPSAIPDKYKSLMSLAVASQIPCHYCIIADTEFARLQGATDVEIREAVGMAALTRFWSTYLNGTMTDEATFKREADQIVARVKKMMARK